MIALDTNFLVYAHRSDNPFHLIARSAIEHLVRGIAPWGIPVVCVHEFLAVVTNPKIFKQATPRTLAFEQIEALLAQPGARLLMPSERHLASLRRLAESGQTIGAQFHDARIAAICLENGVTKLWSADRDFSAYPQLTCQSPKDLLAANFAL
ncbi:MAG: PIN domain-containing protein [Brachymonas sp.]|nr:PIN domain-containing protein [Brachymonas sp.]